MVAFTILGWPVYWYGLLYLTSFLVGYVFLYWFARRTRLQQYPSLQSALIYGLDDVMMTIVLWVIIWGRLGDVFIYNRSYYQNHLSEITQIRKGGMSFVWGIIGVVVAMLIIKIVKKLSLQELFILFDGIVFILPFGIAMGRIWNGLNQELYGKVVQLSYFGGLWDVITNFYQYNIIRLYSSVDNQFRWNTNLFEGLCEGLFLLLFHIVAFGKKIMSGFHYTPWIVSWWFCVLYGIIRFFLETLRDNPPGEYWHGILKSQLLMVALIVIWIWMIIRSKKHFHKLDKSL